MIMMAGTSTLGIVDLVMEQKSTHRRLTESIIL